jgi:hypothetical protein
MASVVLDEVPVENVIGSTELKAERPHRARGEIVLCPDDRYTGFSASSSNAVVVDLNDAPPLRPTVLW